MSCISILVSFFKSLGAQFDSVIRFKCFLFVSAIMSQHVRSSLDQQHTRATKTASLDLLSGFSRAEAAGERKARNSVRCISQLSVSFGGTFWGHRLFSLCPQTDTHTYPFCLVWVNPNGKPKGSQSPSSYILMHVVFPSFSKEIGAFPFPRCAWRVSQRISQGGDHWDLEDEQDLQEILAKATGSRSFPFGCWQPDLTKVFASTGWCTNCC